MQILLKILHLFNLYIPFYPDVPQINSSMQIKGFTVRLKTCVCVITTIHSQEPSMLAVAVYPQKGKPHHINNSMFICLGLPILLWIQSA